MKNSILLLLNKLIERFNKKCIISQDLKNGQFTIQIKMHINYFKKHFNVILILFKIIKECMNTCKYVTRPPRIVKVNSNNFRDWEE